MCVIWTSAWSSENAIASLIFSTGTRQWVWWRLRVWSKTTTWKVNSEPAIELASPRTRRSQRNTRVDTSCPRPEHQQHAAWPDHDRHKDEEPAIEHRRGRADYGATEWIDMRQSSTVRASNTCSTARQTVTTRLNLQPRTTLEATTSEQPDSAGGDDTLNDNDIDDRDHRRHLEQQCEWQL